MRRTDIEIMIDLLQLHGGNWGSEQRVIATLVGEHRWTEQRARSAVTRALATDGRVQRGRGGTIRFSGTDAALYIDVARCLEDYWGPRRGLRNCRARVCNKSHGAKGSGRWVYPDVVLLADPKRRASRTDPLEIHAIEVEQRAGFSIQSVYQAYEQGRGANYSWVLFVGRAQPGEERWDRIIRAAADLGVGLVAMERPHVVGSWSECHPAKRRKEVEPGHRDLLLRATGITLEELERRMKPSAR